MTREEASRILYEQRLVEQILKRIEHAEFTFLDVLGYPHDLAAIDTKLTNESARLPAADRRRVKVAWQLLAWIGQVRSYTALGAGNPSRAAYAALFVGLGAGETVRLAVLAEGEATRRTQTTARAKGGALSSERKRDATGKKLTLAAAAIAKYQAAHPELSRNAAIWWYLRKTNPKFKTLDTPTQTAAIRAFQKKLVRYRPTANRSQKTAAKR